MADNILLNAGTGGATLAADDITSVWYQIIKLAYGALDSATLVTTSAGLPVQQQGNWILAANSGVDIGDVDVTSVIPGVGATNLGKAIDTAAGATDTGIGALAIRDDALGALTPIEGDWVGLRVDANGALWVHDDALDAALGGSELQVDVVAALPAGTNNIGDMDVLSIIPGTGATNLGKAIDTAAGATDTGVAALVVRDDALGALTPIEGDFVALRVDANGALWTHDDALDAALGGSELQVDVVAALPAGTNNIGDVDVLSVVPGTGATSLGKAIDTAAGATDTGVAALVVRDDALGALTPIEGDFVALRVDANGALWTHDDALDAALGGSELQVDVVAALPAGTNAIGKLAANTGVDIGDVDILSIIAGVGATNLGKAEDAVHGSGDTGVYILAVRDDALAVHSGADGDYESLHANAEGALYVRNAPSPTGGATLYKNIDVDESEDQISAAACTLYGFYAYNNAASASKRYLKLYNATAATVIVGTTAVDMTFELDGGQGMILSTGPLGIAFSTALTVAATTGVADADTGAPGANDILFQAWFK